jgi:hypothetical protein
MADGVRGWHLVELGDGLLEGEQVVVLLLEVVERLLGLGVLSVFHDVLLEDGLLAARL